MRKMNNRLICIGAAAGVIMTAALFSVNWDTGRVRIHQHMEALKQMGNESVSIQKEGFASHLPIVEITTGGQKIPGNWILDEEGYIVGEEHSDEGEEMIPVKIRIVDLEKGDNHPADEASVESGALFRIRGNSSRYFSKKSYLFKLTDALGEENPKQVMGMGSHDTWALYGPFLDKTLIRNYMWMNISGEIMGYAPNVRFCEVFLDDVYQGLYVMMETVSRGTGRVNLSGYTPGAAYTDYIVRVDKQNGDIRDLEVFSDYTLRMEHTRNSQTKLSIVYPPKSTLNDKIRSYIEKDFSRFEKALYSSDYRDPIKGYRRYIDVDSFVDYYILQEFLCNNDMCNRSTYLYRDRLGKIHMGPVWDYNNILDNYIRLELDGTGFLYADRLWYDRLLTDETFNRQVRERYRQLRETFLSEDYLIEYIDSTIAFLGESVERNYQAWGDSFFPERLTGQERLFPQERNPRSYEEAVEDMKRFIRRRGEWMDEHMASLAQYSHESHSKQYDNR